MTSQAFPFSTDRPLILGTRGSELALAQVELTLAALRTRFPELPIAVKKIVTSGDRGAKPESDKAGLKGLFTKEIETALRTGEIDVAVHSAKDLPGQMESDLWIAAVLPRAPVNDWLLSKRPEAEIRVVGTSSVRRQRQLAWQFSAWRTVEWRGNVPTRLRKLLETPAVDAIVLAEAGLQRLGIDPKAHGLSVSVLPTLPAVGQGTVALQTRSDEAAAREILAAINHEDTFIGLKAERALLRRLDGDCHLPAAAQASFSNGVLALKALLFLDHEPEPVQGFAQGAADDAEEIAESVFRQLTRTA
jgi:hydroxymethylbilane synthase